MNDGLKTGGLEPLVGSIAACKDGELVTRLALGCRRSMDEIDLRHSCAMRGVAARICGPADADDIVQDVLARLWRTPLRFDARRGSLRSFLLMQTHGRAIDTGRSSTARRNREALTLAGLPSISPAADAEFDSWAGTDHVVGLLGCLLPAEREAIALAFFEGHTYAEAAALLAEPEGTIKGRIRSGLSRMRAACELDPTLTTAAVV